MKALQKAVEVSFKRRGTLLSENIPFALRSVHTWNSCLAKAAEKLPQARLLYQSEKRPPDSRQWRMSIPTPPSAADSHVAKGGSL